jgi:hypothetical protein
MFASGIFERTGCKAASLENPTISSAYQRADQKRRLNTSNNDAQSLPLRVELVDASRSRELESEALGLSTVDRGKPKIE